jgi:hypothetical protein
VQSQTDTFEQTQPATIHEKHRQPELRLERRQQRIHFRSREDHWNIPPTLRPHHAVHLTELFPQHLSIKEKQRVERLVLITPPGRHPSGSPAASLSRSARLRRGRHPVPHGKIGQEIFQVFGSEIEPHSSRNALQPNKAVVDNRFVPLFDQPTALQDPLGGALAWPLPVHPLVDVLQLARTPRRMPLS